MNSIAQPTPPRWIDPEFRTQNDALPAVGHAHLVGALGAGMSALADVLTAAGWTITGSDQAATNKTPGIHVGHSPENLPATADLVVASSAIPRDNCELELARRRSLPVLSYPQMLGRLMRERRGIAIAGAHGKSTVTAMLGEILLAARRDPTIILGASPIVSFSQSERSALNISLSLRERAGVRAHHESIPFSNTPPQPSFASEYPHGGRFGRGEYMVAEACEYRRNFLNLSPEIALVANVEADHFDCFPTSDDCLAAFGEFTARVPGNGLVIYNADCPSAIAATSCIASRRLNFGLAKTADIRGGELSISQGCYSFSLFVSGRRHTRVRLSIPGLHNVHNALAAAAVAVNLDIPGQTIAATLAGFGPLARRLEELPPLGPEGRQVRIFDDYAHHPTEIAASLAALRALCPTGKIHLVFQPHQVSRTERLMDEFAASLQNADNVVIGKVFRAREKSDSSAAANGDPSCILAQKVSRLGTSARFIPELDEIEDHLTAQMKSGELTPGDLIVTMGAGDVGKVAHGLIEP